MADLLNSLYGADSDSMERLRKDLNFMFSHLDYKNVKKLYTEYCEISSEHGETEIIGPVINMYSAGSTTLRLEMGWKASTSGFVFNLYDESGVQTIGLSGVGGTAVFSGSVQTLEDVYGGRHVVVNSTIQPLAFIPASPPGFVVMETLAGSTVITGRISSTYLSTEMRSLFFVHGFSETYFVGQQQLTMYQASTLLDYDLKIYSLSGRVQIGSSGTADTKLYKGVFIGEEYDRHLYTGTNRNASNRVVSIRDSGYELRKDLEYFFSRNVKILFKPSSTSLPATSTNCAITLSTRLMTSTNAGQLTALSSSLSYTAVTETLSPAHDFTTFNDGSAATTDDYLVALAYISSTAMMTTGTGIYLYFGQSSDAYFRFRFASTFGYTFNVGWNLFKMPLGRYDSVNGAPTFNNISYASLGYYCAQNNKSSYLIFDHVGIHRKNPSTWAAPPFTDTQVEYPTRWVEKFYYNSTYCMPLLCTANTSTVGISLCAIDNPTVNILTLGARSTSMEDITTRYFGPDFRAEMPIKLLNSNTETPRIEWSVTFFTNDIVKTYVTSGVLYLSATIAGTSYLSYTNCAAASLGAEATLSLEHSRDGMTRCMFRVDNDPTSIRTVQIMPSTFLTASVVGSFKLGHVTLNRGSIIKNFIVEPLAF
jgi:hypothetical protein